jgi:hypothetical protein
MEREIGYSSPSNTGFKIVETGSGAQTASHSLVTCSFPRIRRMEREVGYSSPSSTGFKIVETGSGAQTASYSLVTCSFPRIRRMEREIGSSSPSSTEFRMSGGISQFTLYAFMTWAGGNFYSVKVLCVALIMNFNCWCCHDSCCLIKSLTSCRLSWCVKGPIHSKSNCAV